MQLSIIIPLYNCERFISKCLQSIFENNIDRKTFEVIVVNDGSTDRSEQIVNSFCKSHKNLIFIKQPNQGNGVARNKGVTFANGEYLYFLDADDYLSKQSLSQLLHILNKVDVDILGFHSELTEVSNMDRSKKLPEKSSYEIISGIDFIKNTNYKAEVWWYFVKKSFYEKCNISFYDKKFVQDAYVTTELLLKAEKILYVPLDAHRYRKHDQSITKNKSAAHISKHIEDLFFAIEKLDQLITNVPDKDCFMRLKSRQESYFFFLLLRFPHSNLSFKDLNKLVSKAKKLSVYPLKYFIGADYNGLKYRILVFILNCCIFRILFLFSQRLLIKFQNIK